MHFGSELSANQQARLANWFRLKRLPPLGYVHDKKRTRFLPDPTIAPLVRQAFERVLDGVMPVEVLRRLNDELGFRTPRRGRLGGRPLARGAFYRMLHDPFYAGKIRSDFGIIPGEHEAILSDLEYQKVQATLGNRGRRSLRRQTELPG